jgi:hypothetical protein
VKRCEKGVKRYEKGVRVPGKVDAREGYLRIKVL